MVREALLVVTKYTSTTTTDNNNSNNNKIIVVVVVVDIITPTIDSPLMSFLSLTAAQMCSHVLYVFIVCLHHILDAH